MPPEEEVVPPEEEVLPPEEDPPEEVPPPDEDQPPDEEPPEEPLEDEPPEEELTGTVPRSLENTTSSVSLERSSAFSARVRTWLEVVPGLGREAVALTFQSFPLASCWTAERAVMSEAATVGFPLFTCRKRFFPDRKYSIVASALVCGSLTMNLTLPTEGFTVPR